jgi:cytochrome c553
MLGVAIIAVVMTCLAGGVAYGASRGKLGGLSRIITTESKGGKTALNTSLVFVYLAFGIAVPLIFIFGNHAKSNAAWAGVKLTASEQAGRQLFAQRCAFCHTLDAANAVGKTGPNLDTLKPSAATVLSTIGHGCTETGASGTQCLGYGTMPAQIYQGQDAKDVANFVAAVAGRK